MVWAAACRRNRRGLGDPNPPQPPVFVASRTFQPRAPIKPVERAWADAFRVARRGQTWAMFVIALRGLTLYRMWRRLPARRRAALRARAAKLGRQLGTRTARRGTAFRASLRRD